MDRTPGWTEADVAQALAEVRQALLGFLRQRTRLDWFKQKVRWRLSRRYIWPGAPEGAQKLVEEMVGDDAGVSAIAEHLRSEQRKISNAIERHNTVVRRLMEQQHGVPAARFDEATRRQLEQRRITFQGTREELLRRGRRLATKSGSEPFPELLSLRLAILPEDVRDDIFREVSTRIADEVAIRQSTMSVADRNTLAAATEARLRCRDRYHVARLLAEDYPEARRMVGLDPLLERCQRLGRPDPMASDDEARARGELREALSDVARRSIGFLEGLYPSTSGSHTHELRALDGERQPATAERHGDAANNSVVR